MRVVLFCHSLRLRLEPRQRALPARRLRRAARARPRGRRLRAGGRAGACSNLVAEHGEAPLRRLRAAPTRACAATATTPDDARPRRGARRRRPRARARVERRTRWSGASALHRAANAALPAAVPRHAPPLRHRRRTAWPPTTCAHYDGVLAFGEVIRDLYLQHGWARAPGPGTRRPTRACSSPLPGAAARGRPGLDRQLGRRRAHGRAARVPARAGAALGLQARVHGVRYPGARAAAPARRRHRATAAGCRTTRRRGCSRATRVTVHVPRRPYVQALPGIPTIRVFEALACGIPLVSAPWDDARACSTPGRGLPGRARRRARCASTCAPCWTTPALAAVAGRARAARRSWRATPARTASTSCWPSTPNSRAGAGAARGTSPHERTEHATSPSSARAWSRPTGTAPPPTTAASSARCTSAATTSPSTSPTPSTASSTATSPIRRWARVVVYSGARARPRCCARSSRRAAPTWWSRPAASACSTTLLEARGARPAGPGDAGRVLGRRRAGHARPHARRPGRPVPRRCVPRYDLVLTYGGGDPVRRGLPGARRARLRADLQRARPEHAPSRSRRDPRFDGDLGFLGNRLPDREARVEEFFLRAAALLPERRFLLGGSGWERQADAGQRAATSATSTPPTTTPSTARRCAVLNVSRESMARYGFSPATRVFEAAGAGACLITDAWEGHRAVPRAGHARCWSRATATRSPQHVRRARRAQRARAIGEAALPPRAGRAHLRAPRGAARGACWQGARGRCRGGRHERRCAIVILGLSITSSWGNGHATTYRGLVRELARARPRRAVPRARRALVRRATATCPTRRSARTVLYGSLDELQRPLRATRCATPTW